MACNPYKSPYVKKATPYSQNKKACDIYQNKRKNPYKDKTPKNSLYSGKPTKIYNLPKNDVFKRQD